MITATVLLLLLYGILGSYAFYQARQKQRLYWQDIITPGLVILAWGLITSTGYGPQSLTHFIEVPIALFLCLILYYYKVFFFNESSRLKRLFLPLSGLIIVFLLRTFMPELPE